MIKYVIKGGGWMMELAFSLTKLAMRGILSVEVFCMISYFYLVFNIN